MGRKLLTLFVHTTNDCDETVLKKYSLVYYVQLNHINLFATVFAMNNLRQRSLFVEVIPGYFTRCR